MLGGMGIHGTERRVQPVLSEDCDGILKNGIFDTTAIADKSFSRMVLAAELTKLTAKEAR